MNNRIPRLDGKSYILASWNIVDPETNSEVHCVVWREDVGSDFHCWVRFGYGDGDDSKSYDKRNSYVVEPKDAVAKSEPQMSKVVRSLYKSTKSLYRLRSSAKFRWVRGSVEQYFQALKSMGMTVTQDGEEI